MLFVLFCCFGGEYFIYGCVVDMSLEVDWMMMGWVGVFCCFFWGLVGREDFECVV